LRSTIERPYTRNQEFEAEGREQGSANALWTHQQSRERVYAANVVYISSRFSTLFCFWYFVNLGLMAASA